jgi:hypothetical protein
VIAPFQDLLAVLEQTQVGQDELVAEHLLLFSIESVKGRVLLAHEGGERRDPSLARREGKPPRTRNPEEKPTKR